MPGSFTVTMRAMADRGGDLPAGAKDFLYLFYFAGGFQNQQFRAHDVLLWRPSGGAESGRVARIIF